VATTLLALSFCSCRSRPAPGTALHPTPAWSGNGPGNLRLRAAPDDGALLLRQGDGGVYRYDPTGRTLAAVPAIDWDRGGTVEACDRQRPAIGTLPVALGGHPVGISPDQLVGSRLSPSGRFAQVTTSVGTGEKAMAFIAAGHKPPFHHNLFELPAGLPVGTPLLLPFDDGGDLQSCWSLDERFVVYTDLSMRALAVVTLGAGDGGTVP
jgi:hypothetical protein